ncbi:NADH-quinone oxidoreductase subunit NuoG [Kangiella sp. HZ709]|uniref:NADH-quinone oxidoreductase subunit NuoG n=1 Tax=Kangiella sp. HZ709 TaxID=2666328 RepID=UPI0012AFCB05|nr:NADH-quinone oxidoreductase subunit NuoG [Kangiella sp. HZ709]MRX27754.1 NADH-quinone oxidoreductase subunit G [Kangiella sp. HZ709]
MVTIEINGQKVEAEQGSMIIEVADSMGVEIPRFCYHKKLSVAANCRMCLVEVEGQRKPLPACATPIADGMVIKTESGYAKDAQKSVMEFLLINHPLDCPICDQGGECELQDVALECGKDVSRFTERKRAVEDKDIGPLIETEMTRCIHCTRCVRFGREVAGIREMGAVGRGEHTEISTFIEKSVESEVSGNIIDLCPVGALTAKPSRYQARAWEMIQYDSIAPHDCIGTNLHVHTRRNEIIRLAPKENEMTNEVWLSDRDRYSYESLTKAKRLLQPMSRQGSEWQEIDWEAALEKTASKLNMIKEAHGPEQIAGIGNPIATTEELYLLQKIVRGLGSDNVDHRLRIADFAGQDYESLYPQLGIQISHLESLDSCFLIGSNMRKEQPLAALRIRKATRHGLVASLSAHKNFNNFKLKHELVKSGQDWCLQLAAITKYLSQQPQNEEALVKFDGLQDLLVDVTVEQEHIDIAQMLVDGTNSSVILGLEAVEHSQASKLRQLAKAVAKLSGSSYGFLSHGANSAGAYLAGAIPHRGPAGASVSDDGHTMEQIVSNGKKALILLKTELGKDSIWSEKAVAMAKQADFVVALTSFADDEAFEYADIVLPIAGYLESAGSYVNVNGIWQEFNASVTAPGQAKPAWKVLRVLGNLLKLKNFDYVSAQDVMQEVKGRMGAVGDKVKSKWHCPDGLVEAATCPEAVNIYQSDCYVRRAPALQKTAMAQGQEDLKRPQLSPFHNIMGGV